MQPIPSPFSSSTLGIDYSLTDAMLSLSKLNNWTERYRQLFKLADRIIRLDQQWRKDCYLVEGCETPVWLLHHYDTATARHYFLADSDSKIIKGLLVLILSACNGQPTEAIRSIELQPVLEQLDLGKYLTPSRNNGLLSVMEEIKKYCPPSPKPC